MKSENEEDKEQELTTAEPEDIVEQAPDGESVDEDLIEILNSSPEVRETIMSAMYAGPVPPPHMLAEYEDVLPGMADRILGMAEKEQGIRSRDNKILLLNDTFRVFGSIFVSISLVAGAVISGFIGQPALGIALAGSAVFGQIVKQFNKRKDVSPKD